MIIEKRADTYTILHSEKILKKISYHDLVKMMCSDDTLIFENYGVGIYIEDENDHDWYDWYMKKGFSKDEFDVICKLTNEIKPEDIYLKIAHDDIAVIITHTDYIKDNKCTHIWLPYEGRGMCGIETYVLVAEGKKLDDYICVVRLDEDHEQDMEMLIIKVKDEKWFENSIIPKFKEVFENIEIKVLD